MNKEDNQLKKQKEKSEQFDYESFFQGLFKVVLFILFLIFVLYVTKDTPSEIKETLD